MRPLVELVGRPRDNLWVGREYEDGRVESGISDSETKYFAQNIGVGDMLQRGTVIRPSDAYGSHKVVVKDYTLAAGTKHVEDSRFDLYTIGRFLGHLDLHSYDAVMFYHRMRDPGPLFEGEDALRALVVSPNEDFHSLESQIDLITDKKQNLDPEPKEWDSKFYMSFIVVSSPLINIHAALRENIAVVPAAVQGKKLGYATPNRMSIWDMVQMPEFDVYERQKRNASARI